MSRVNLSSILCSACSHVFDRNDWPAGEHEERAVPHHDSRAKLELAARNGCRLCRLVMETEEFQERRNDPAWETTLTQPGVLFVTRRAGIIILSFFGIDTDNLPMGRCPWVEIDVLDPNGG